MYHKQKSKMKKFTLLFVLAFFIQATAISQFCLPDGIVFTTQTQIDNFQINYPGCTIVEGDIEITGDDITNLDSLAALTAIDGDLFIGYSTALTSIAGLGNVGYIGQTIRIYMNSALTNLSGLDNIVLIDQNLRITNNDVLSDISALGSLTRVGENLRIYMNSALTSLTGLDNVISVGNNLRITNNTALTSISALAGLTSIAGELAIDNNDALVSLEGLDNIDAGSITDLVIRNNLLLSTCDVQSICNYLIAPNGDISIHDNAGGCNSKEEVIALCADGISEISKFKFIVYPNPAHKEIIISSKNEIVITEVIIYNSLGQRVVHKDRVISPIDVSMLNEGMYIIEIVSGITKIREKLIIK